MLNLSATLMIDVIFLYYLQFTQIYILHKYAYHTHAWFCLAKVEQIYQ